MSQILVSARRTASTMALAVVLATSGAVISVASTPTSLGPTNDQRRALAVVEARHLLTFVALPSGSRRLAGSHTQNMETLLSMGASSADPDQVDLTRFFLVARGTWALAWLEQHVPRGGVPTGWGTGGGPGVPTSHTVTYSFPTPPTLAQAQLQYSMVITASGELGLRVDADVLWTPRKSRFAFVARGPTTVVVTMDRGLNVKSHRVTTVVVSGRATVAAFRSAINDLAVATPGIASCPVDVGALMTLAFWRPGAESAYAVVAADPGGCGGVTVTQLAQGGATLGVGHDSGGLRLVRFVATTLTIRNWSGLT